VQRLLGHRDKRKRLLLGHLHQDDLGLQDHLALCLLVLGEGSAAARARARAAADALAVLWDVEHERACRAFNTNAVVTCA